MKKSFFGAIISLGLVSVAHAAGIPVSVARFNQEAQHVLDTCHGFVFTYQDQLQTELERDLSMRGLRVLERRDIRKIYDEEYEMPNLNRKKIARRNRFVAARYSITGGITELGICEESSGTGVQLGGIISLLGGPSVDLRAGRHGSVSKVKVVAQVVSVETGEILKSFSAYSEVSDKSYALEGGVYGIGAAHSAATQPPIERATNRAIKDLAGQIAVYLNRPRDVVERD